MANEPTLRLVLSVPYRIEACTMESVSGVWVRRATHPELPDCIAEAATIEETLARLEDRRIKVLVALLKAGASLPMPRPPLQGYDAEGLLLRHGLHDELSQFLDIQPLHWHG
jgi:predicted RNase H-like HicB family nuclease